MKEFRCFSHFSPFIFWHFIFILVESDRVLCLQGVLSNHKAYLSWLWSWSLFFFFFFQKICRNTELEKEKNVRRKKWNLSNYSVEVPAQHCSHSGHLSWTCINLRDFPNCLNHIFRKTLCLPRISLWSKKSQAALAKNWLSYFISLKLINSQSQLLFLILIKIQHLI